MSKINEGEVLTKITGMLNDSYMRGYQDALNTKLTEQPKLSIPKKIADALDKLEFDWNMMAFPNSPQGDYQDLFDYIDRGNAPIIMTYLAGKALGVELVEVEG